MVTGTDAGNDCAVLVSPCRAVQHHLDVAESEDSVKISAGTYTDTWAQGGTTQVAYISKTVALPGGYTTTSRTGAARRAVATDRTIVVPGSSWIALPLVMRDY